MARALQGAWNPLLPPQPQLPSASCTDPNIRLDWLDIEACLSRHFSRMHCSQLQSMQRLWLRPKDSCGVHNLVQHRGV